MLDFFTLPERSAKPRDAGISHVIDKGIGLRQMEDLLDTASGYIDILKLGWGTGYVTQNLFEKIKAYHAAGVPVCFGGTFVELAILQNRFDAFRAMAKEAGITHVEISNGVVDMTPREKSRYIRELARDFVVLSEVGSKDSEKIIPPYRWVELIQSDLDAGARKVICEARESGSVGLYFGTGEIRSGLIDEIVAKVDPVDLIFEAPLKSQQVWLVRKFGSEVNLGNIATPDVIGLETLRLGLRADTMAEFHSVDEWNERRSADAASETPHPKRRSQRLVS
jgi:phosphosulfolactate synthase